MWRITVVMLALVCPVFAQQSEEPVTMEMEGRAPRSVPVTLAYLLQYPAEFDRSYVTLDSVEIHRIERLLYHGENTYLVTLWEPSTSTMAFAPPHDARIYFFVLEDARARDVIERKGLCSKYLCRLSLRIVTTGKADSTGDPYCIASLDRIEWIDETGQVVDSV